MNDPFSKLNLEDLIGTNGTLLEAINDQFPNADGMLLDKELQLPHFQRGLYFHPIDGHEQWCAGNRVEGSHFTEISDLKKLKNRDGEPQFLGMGNFLILDLGDGSYFGILPLVTTNAATELEVVEDKLLCKIMTWGTESVHGKLPLLAYATAKDPYAVARICWEQALPAVQHSTQMREQKEYPEAMNYLGWCSWEKFGWDIDENNMNESVEGLKNCPAPLRWFLLDDGYLDIDEGRQLLSFGYDKEKFPEGFKSITDLKNETNISWMGIWRNFNGYNRGVSPNHTMSHLKEHFREALAFDHPEKLIIKQANAPHMILVQKQEAADAFYHEMVTQSKNEGFDFIKVDFQSRSIGLNQLTENAVLATTQRNVGLEKACQREGLGLMNCIGQVNLNFFNSKHSTLTRAGEDYFKGMMNTRITQQCFNNALWMSPIAWPDFDSFYTINDDADILNLARVLSGGPFYFADDPDTMNAKLLEPVAFKDGRILRTLAPGQALPDSLFTDTLNNPEAFQTIAPLKHKVAAIGSFNFQGDTPVVSTIKKDNYRFAGSMIQPYDGLWESSEGLVIYDWFDRCGYAQGGNCEKELPPYGIGLHLIAPITQGWAVIGRSDKFLGAMAVESIEIDAQSMTLSMSQSGPTVFYSETQPSCEEADITV
jgi:hypothetical protein